jgi:hypothetical protein
MKSLTLIEMRGRRWLKFCGVVLGKTDPPYLTPSDHLRSTTRMNLMELEDAYHTFGYFETVIPGAKRSSTLKL